MRFCDLTMAYNETSGGIRTYLDAKRKYLLEHTSHHHILIVPAAYDSIEQTGRAITVHVASPTIPGFEPYRMFLRPDKIERALEQFAPDCVELGSVYVCPWVAFNYRDIASAEGRHPIVGGFFHTDVPEAYVGSPLRHTLAATFGHLWEPLKWLGEMMADAAESAVATYIQSVFLRCDLRIAPSVEQAARLEGYGVNRVNVVPLGVDLEHFHPSQRSEEVRKRFGAGRDDLILLYAGRLMEEKRVTLLLEAFRRLPDRARFRLVIVGEGSLREELLRAAQEIENVFVLPYEKDPNAFACLLASADIYVTAGPHETFGLSVVEAQASGLPVVGVSAGALIERVPQGTGLLGPPDDQIAMRDNIILAASERPQLAEGARKHVEEHFSWNRTFQRLISYYTQRFSCQREEPSPAAGPAQRNPQLPSVGPERSLTRPPSDHEGR